MIVNVSMTRYPDVQKKLESLPNNVEDRVRSKLEEPGNNPGRNLKPLIGRDDYSLRIGKRRAIIDWDKQANELQVLKIDSRDIVYQ